MHNQPKTPVIGGSYQGLCLQTDARTDEIKIDSHTGDDSTSDSMPTESYQRRRFYGEVFGAGFDCFVLEPDYETETEGISEVVDRES